LPAPEEPTTATVCPASTTKDTPWRNLDRRAEVEGGHLLEGREGDLLRRRVAEVDVVERHRDGAVGKGRRARVLGDERRYVEDLEDPLEAHHGSGDVEPGRSEGGEG